ncbi:MAG: baseplate J/gp47 family protein [Desulfobacterales bacterium]|nr:baseplate J/gp47 family protein [Desulfobacterales bacterium]
MNARHDLTRWNRANLSRFRYIDGNAVTFLETLRQALIDRFTDQAAETLQWESLVSGPPDDPSGEGAYERLKRERARIQRETERERLDRISEQYDGDRRDWGWEIARVLARSAHVLTEYIDAYANEGFLRTATQWDNVRRLVEMLDYHPAPPASAATLLAIEAKPDADGTLEAGLQVKYTPPDGSPPVVFETLTDIVIHADLNQLRPAGYDRSQDLLDGRRFVLASEVEGLEIGAPAVLEDETTGALRGHRISAFEVEGDTTRIWVDPPISPPLPIGYTIVHLNPEEPLDPMGPVVASAPLGRKLHLTVEPQELELKKAIYIADKDTVYYRRPVEIDGRHLVLNADVGHLRLAEAWVGLPLLLSVEYTGSEELVVDTSVEYTFKTAGDWSYLADRQVAKPMEELPVYTVSGAEYNPVADGTEAEEGYTILKVVWDPDDHTVSLDDAGSLFVPPAVSGQWPVDSYLERPKGRLPTGLTAGLPLKTDEGDLAVVDNGRHMAWARLETVKPYEDVQQADLIAETGWFEDGSSKFYLTETLVRAHFKDAVRLRDWQVNPRTLTGSRIPLSIVPAALEKGRSLIVENADDPAAAFAAIVTAIDESRNPAELVLNQDLPAGFTYANTLVAANVVSAGHGETKGEKVLGSGDATRLSQAFVLRDTNVAFIADATQPAGVRAAIEVKVVGRVWEQVAGFQNSLPTDAHYTVRLTEEGSLKITFGDGQRGRRLPTGSNNVRLTYRKGTGLGGNLDAGSFIKAAKPHHLVDKVRQPLPATGGNDMETLASLRENAPATLLTLERAVSLEDFDYLVTSQSSVWQAKAFARPTGLGRNQMIEVVVVPAGGGELGALAETLTDFILAHTVPGLEVMVTAYRPRTFGLEVLITVDSAAYNPEEVTAAVKSGLEEAFSLENRKLGQDVFLSEVYQVVEAVTGVAHSQAVINGSGVIRRLPAGDRDVLTLGRLLVTHQGGEDTPTQAATAPATSAPAAPRLIGGRELEVIHGIGGRYAELLKGSGVRTVEDLRRHDPQKPPKGITTAELSVLATKAELITSLDVDAFMVMPLLHRSLFELLQTGADDLARDSGQTPAFGRQLLSKLRVLQVVLDRAHLERITLRELLFERPAGQTER